MIQVASRLHEIGTIDSDFMVYRLPDRSNFRVITNHESPITALVKSHKDLDVWRAAIDMARDM